ncbi:endoribonuclease YbeY [Spirochaetia bacterium]|nr:endoribonuclease YbeY [Spirochaetia bacterium]
MNNIDINTQGVTLPEWAEGAESYIKKILEKLGRDNWDLSVLFCTNTFIQTLNKQYRGKDEPTDILSFSQHDNTPAAASPPELFAAGDIVISLEALCDNAAAFSITNHEELCRLLIHGILHLDCMDHKTNSVDDEPMLQLQERLLGEI